LSDFTICQLETAVEKICELQAKPLLAIMEEPRSATLVKNSVRDPVLYLDRLSDVFRHVAPSNGCIGEWKSHLVPRSPVELFSSPLVSTRHTLSSSWF
jgi:hypothetical protein